MINPRLRLPTAFLTLSVCALAGCGSLDNCPDGAAEPIVIDTGTTDKANLTFESAPWGGPLDAFPAKSELEFKHELGVTPLLAKAYLSFSKVGTDNQKPGSVTEVAGDEAPIECVDSHVIVVKNNTCERSFFIRVVTFGVSPSGSDDTNCTKK